MKLSSILEGGKIREIESQIPSSPRDIKYTDYIGFVSDDEKYMDAEDRVGSIPLLVSALSHILDFKSFEFGNIHASLLTLLLIRKKIIETFNNYEQVEYGADFMLDYKGEKYYLTQDRAFRFAGLSSLTIQQVVEVAESIRLHKMREPKNYNHDVVHNLDNLAMLLLKENERLPTGINELAIFRQQRAKHFADVTLADIQGVTFFLTNTIKKFEKTRNTSTHLKESQSQNTRKAQNKEASNRKSKQ